MCAGPVKAALIADGGIITHDPLKLPVGSKNLFVDLGAERLLAADKEGRKIAVELKSFPGESELEDLEMALRRYVLYRGILQETEPERAIYLDVSGMVYDELSTEPIGQAASRAAQLRLIVFDPHKGVIIRWILDWTPIATSSSGSSRITGKIPTPTAKSTANWCSTVSVTIISC